MGMTAGTVTVAADGTVTKSGLAGEIFDEFVDNYADDIESITGEPAEPIPDGADGAKIKQGYAIFARNVATAVVTHISANADVTITTSDAGLQRDPATSNDTLAPSGDKTLIGAVS